MYTVSRIIISVGIIENYFIMSGFYNGFVGTASEIIYAVDVKDGVSSVDAQERGGTAPSISICGEHSGIVHSIRQRHDGFTNSGPTATGESR